MWKEVSGTKTYFHYADEGLIGEYDASGVEIKTYGYKPGSTWTTDPLFMKVGTEYYFYHNDHLGTPQKMTAVNGAVVWSAKYDSFGKADVDATSSITNNLRFPGQYEDAETGLHYNYHRYYDARIGRYLRMDPIGFDGLDFTLYGYAQNNPNFGFDSSGLLNENSIKSFCQQHPVACAEAIKDGTIPIGVAVTAVTLDAMDCEKNSDGACDDVYRQIKDAVKELKRRYTQQKRDKKNLPLIGKNSLMGHEYQFYDVQTTLQTLISMAYMKKCFAYDKNADKWATMQAPIPGRFRENPEAWKQIREQYPYDPWEINPWKK